MRNNWSAQDAEATAARYGAQGVGRDLALRLYTTRLLGREPKLVLHGGGNTSVMTTMQDPVGRDVRVLCVKGSGWDMGDIEPAGLPAVRLEPLRELTALDGLSDEDMVNVQRVNMLEATGPNPSVETLLHAFLPHKFVDHTHANAVLALTDQPDGVAICRDTFGDEVALVPYIMPGFALAKRTWQLYEANPGVEGMVMLKHGVFTFADTAEEAYGRMIALVTKAEQRIAKAGGKVFAAAALPDSTATAAAIAPILRGLAAQRTDAGDYRRMILDYRTSQAIADYVDGADVARYSQQGVVTPDHSIRTKPVPLIVPAPEAGDLAGFAAGARQAFATFAAAYHDYFTRQNAAQATPRIELDPIPRVILVPGVGLFGLGNSAKAAAIAADLAETAVEVTTDAEAVGAFRSIDEPEMFEIEYWSLEQAKLGKAAEKPLARQIAVVTGGASGIGAATAAALRAQGAEVAVVDRDGAAATATAEGIGALAIACDVTDPGAVRAAFDAVCEAFGGVDILVSNAGAAWQGRIGEVDDAVLRQSFDVNFFGHQTVAKAAVAIMLAQGTGGCLLFNTSKQAVNPGKDFGPYGLPKAATLFLMRQYALDYGGDGIRANAVNADRVRSGLLTDTMVKSRAAARGLSDADYMAGNLLGREVTAADVADAFVALALARASTGAVLTVDGGNIAAALR